ncbi:MAG: electron transport complex subunit E [Gammaproteobacteria bacterium]|nr:electron transport complex subunit E [Gammaproteobacteria bacterium]
MATPAASLTSKTEIQSADTFIKGLWRENPVFVALLGMCPVLAVTNSVINALAIGLASTFVVTLSSTIVSLAKNVIPKQVRIASYILIIATFVTVTEYVLQALSYDVHKALGAFIPLIVVNCMILGRSEAFASRNSVGLAALDALGMGLGFTVACLSLGTVRELLGNGTLLGIPIFGPSFEPWVIMVLPPGGFLVLGMWLLSFSWFKHRKEARQ